MDDNKIPVGVARMILNSTYGKTGFYRPRGGYRDTFFVKRGFRGYGMVYHLMQQRGYEKLVAPLIRFQLRYPLWLEVDEIRQKLLIVHRNFRFASLIYVDTDSAYWV